MPIFGLMGEELQMEFEHIFVKSEKNEQFFN